MAEATTTTDDSDTSNTGEESTTVTDEGTTTGDNSATSTTDNDTDTSTGGQGEEEVDAPATTFDDDLDDWAEKTGRAKPDSDRERELYQEIRDGQREFSRSRSSTAASEKMGKALEDNRPTPGDEEEDEDEDPLVKETRELRETFQEERNLRLRSEFFATNQITETEGDAMAEILKEKVEKGGKAAFDYWSNPDNLSDLYDLAKYRNVQGDTSQVEAEAARKERERIAKESQANGPSRNASKTRTSDKTEDEQRLERFSNWASK